MDKGDQAVIHSSEDPNWRTPPDCFAALHRAFRFNWDVAADVASSHCGSDFLGPGSSYAEDGLAVAWSGLKSPFFLNPPFSRTLERAYSTGRIKREGVWVEHPKDAQLAAVYTVEAWAQKCWLESQRGCTIVAVLPFAPQTDWYRQYVMGHFIPKGAPVGAEYSWSGHAAMEEWRLPHRISFLRPTGEKSANAGVNSVVIVWRPNPGFCGPFMPAVRYWSYR